ncbi:MAG: nitronate monooxygenase [Hydrococcus sp. C42_A2020_068]|nr:nitronate monooxygenase [Hydrococcus sp. C42_A2020_068]
MRQSSFQRRASHSRLSQLSAIASGSRYSPVIAAGGIWNRTDIDRVLALGAKGVQIGTRFITGLQVSRYRHWIAPDAHKG